MSAIATYHRYKTPTQTEEDIALQIESLEIWGKASQNFYCSEIPKVKTYVGKIPKGKAGIEFTTDVCHLIPIHHLI